MEKHSIYPMQQGFTPRETIRIGGILFAEEPINYNENRPVIKLRVRNTGDRPIQVGSHFHLFEANRYLQFDRKAAFGCHLNIPATTAIRFEPGDERWVEIVPYAGKERIIGFNGLVQGYTGREDTPSYYPAKVLAFRRMKSLGFRDVEPIHTHNESKQREASERRESANPNSKNNKSEK